VDALAGRGDWPGVVKVVVALAQTEQRAAETPGARSYAVALRRVLPRATVEQIAPMVLEPQWRERAIAVLRRIGAEGTDVLLQRLATAATLSERKGYYAAVQQMTEGVPLVVNMLTHGEWFVVRNAADLAGDLQLEEAVPQLARQIQHPDERVRRSVVNALAKIGTAGSIEPLRQALRDSSSAVRLLGARALDGWKFRGLAMTLAVLSEEEQDPEVQKEMLLALGRIGTPEALQALARAAQPGRRIFGRKPVSLRLTAVEALRLAGPAAQTALQGLLADDDVDVRSAARKALAAVAG
jgi:HEAT repeat protein